MIGLVRIAGLGGWHIEADPAGTTLCGLELPLESVERAVLVSGVGCPHCQDAIAADERRERRPAAAVVLIRCLVWWIRVGVSLVPDRCISPLCASFSPAGVPEIAPSTPIP